MAQSFVFRRVICLLAFAVAVIGAACGAAATAHAAGQVTGPTVATADGGTRETLESVFISPKPGAPFSLVLDTEWAKPMFGGGTVTMANRRRIMRDSSGRIYQERWSLAPKGGKTPSTMAWIQIADPNAHTQLNCEVVRKHCDIVRYGGSAQVTYVPFTRPTGALPAGDGTVQHEELGVDEVAGLRVSGVRETTTIAAGARGNDQPMVTVREFWYCEPLGINLRSSLQSPSAGKQTFVTSDVLTQEPEESYFKVPDGYTVADHRMLSPGQQP